MITPRRRPGRPPRRCRRGPGDRLGRLSAVLLAAAVLALAACDSGPSGPGTVTVFATAPSLGGAVMEVQGSGIRSFEGGGSARVYSAPVDARPGVHRVIVISPEPGELVFDVEVADLGADGPAVTVISAADGENRTMRSAEVSVRVGG